MSDAQYYVLVASAVVVLMFATSLWLRTRRRGGPMVEQTRVTAPMKSSLDAPARRRVTAAMGGEILRLLEEGRREEAVGLVRGATGWGAKEADEAVAKLEDVKKRLES